MTNVPAGRFYAEKRRLATALPLRRRHAGILHHRCVDWPWGDTVDAHALGPETTLTTLAGSPAEVAAGTLTLPGETGVSLHVVG